jgi:hypothetical protein
MPEIKFILREIARKMQEKLADVKLRKKKRLKLYATSLSNKPCP